MSSLKSIRDRVMLTVARGVVRLVNDATKLQSAQVSLMAREVRDGIERFQNYGFTAKPHPGAEGVVVFVGGNRDHGLLIAVDDRRYRLTALEDGEVAIYTDEGDKIHLKRGNEIEVTTATLTVNASTLVQMTAPNIELNAATMLTVNSPLSVFSGDLQAAGDILDNAGSGGQTSASMRTIYNSHNHDENDSGGPTDAPNQAM
jgi:phage baseplate assembly protein V